jgi:hypothetical protein
MWGGLEIHVGAMDEAIVSRFLSQYIFELTYRKYFYKIHP